MTLTAGTFLGPYQIIGPLGAGGMGEVYRASDVRLGRDVAIKVLPERLLNDRQALARFERETRALAALSHPNVLAIFDVGSSGTVGYAVMELLEGETLRTRIERASIPWRRAVEVGVAIADGLAAAHARGLIHRDLKPENVYLTSDGGVKILDFGLACSGVAAAEATTSIATEVGTVMGTPGYMSPEQVRGEPAGPSTDIFSLGCVLYEMIAGRRTFAGPSMAERIAATLTAEPPRIGGIPMELERSIAHCLEKRPKDRFDSARDVAFALKTAIGADSREGGAVIDSIAVLPFSTAAVTPDAEYLSDGITESVINALAQMSAQGHGPEHGVPSQGRRPASSGSRSRRSDRAHGPTLPARRGSHDWRRAGRRRAGNADVGPAVQAPDGRHLRHPGGNLSRDIREIARQVNRGRTTAAAEAPYRGSRGISVVSPRSILLEPAHGRRDAKGSGALSAGHRSRSRVRAGLRGTRRRPRDAWHLPRSETKRFVSESEGGGTSRARDRRGSRRSPRNARVLCAVLRLGSDCRGKRAERGHSTQYWLPLGAAVVWDVPRVGRAAGLSHTGVEDCPGS